MNHGRVAMLEQTIDAVKNRGKYYGPPGEHFGRTVGAINALFKSKLKEPLTEADWAQFMIIDKIAREQERAKPDNAVDMAGYAACLFEVSDKRYTDARIPRESKR